MAKYKFNASDWTVAVGGTQVPWQQIDVTFEQFHVPASFAISLPLRSIDIPKVLPDKAPEVVVRHLSKEFFVGQLDESSGNLDGGLDDLVLTGRDLAARLVLAKVIENLPQNLTASEMVQFLCKGEGLTDFSGVTATTEQIGEFVKHTYHHITKGLCKHDVCFDLAEYHHYLFRVWKRSVFFGPQPKPKWSRSLTYQRDFTQASWSKSHTNSDVTVRVLSWNHKAKQKVSQTAGTGSIVITKIVPGLTAIQAKALANKTLESAERNLLTLKIRDLPGDVAYDDVNWQFKVLGVGAGISQDYWPARIHHVITQDDHVVDLDLYNAKRVAA